MEMRDVTEESPQYYKNVGSLHTDVEINVAPADSKIYMEKKSKEPKITKTLLKKNIRREMPYQL